MTGGNRALSRTSALAATVAAFGVAFGLAACGKAKPKAKAKDDAGASIAATGAADAPMPNKDEGAHVLVVVTVDWEGAYLSEDGLDMLDALRHRLPDVPFTHFVSAGYFTKERLAQAGDAPKPGAEIKAQLRPIDEMAIHVHTWRSLVRAADVKVRLAPSFLTGTDKLLEFEGGDTGFDSDLDNYTVAELRAIIATSRRLLIEAGLSPSTSFRAGGYLGTPKVLEAARAEGLVVDSSAIDHRQLVGPENVVLRDRLAAVWPSIDATAQPRTINTAAGDVVEVPIATFMENTTTAKVVEIVHHARAQLLKAPRGDVVVVLGFHQETAQEFGPTLLDALEKLRADSTLSGQLQYTTVEAAAKRLRAR